MGIFTYSPLISVIGYDAYIIPYARAYSLVELTVKSKYYVVGTRS